MHTCWEERKFQREQVGVAIAIYYNDFDLPHASVTTAGIHWMDQAGLQLMLMCIHMPVHNNRTASKDLLGKIPVLMERVHIRLYVLIKNKLKCILSYEMLTSLFVDPRFLVLCPK